MFYQMYMKMVSGRCNLSIVPLRAEAAHRSEMVSQVLFGEEFEILEETQDWTRIRLFSPDYEGWIQNGQYSLLDPIEGGSKEGRRVFVVDLSGAVGQSKDLHVTLVPGTTIVINDYSSSVIDWFELDGKLRMPTLRDFETEFPKLIAHYKNVPYLWGGRSQYGIDCSGLSLAIYRHFGVDLPRDAYQQAEYGEVVDFLTEIKAGDLAFFDNEDGKITHVGIMIDAETILHASARVRIDKMDSEGIFNKELNRYTHKLRIVKRYF